MNDNDILPIDGKGGIKLVSESKSLELQHNALYNEDIEQEKQLNKNRSKKNLKNKYQSSAVLYETAL